MDDFPDFMFRCHGCGREIDPDRSVGEAVPKGGGFSSMRLFCTRTCADGTLVEHALLDLDDEYNRTGRPLQDEYIDPPEEDEDHDPSEEDEDE